MRSTKLVIADRHPIVLHGLTSVFAEQREFVIVASCSDGAGCIEAMRSLAPDVAMLDSMADMTASQVLATVKAEGLVTRLVFFTASVDQGDLVAATAAGACSMIPKSLAPDRLVQSLRKIMDDWDLPRVSSALDQPRKARNDATETVLQVLTDRESEVMRLVSEGLSNKEIARRLKISQGTTKVHLHHIYQKLEINNRTVLAALAISRQYNAASSSGNGPAPG